MSQEPTPQEEIKQFADDTRELAEHAHDYYNNVRSNHGFRRLYDENPYLVLAAAAGAGYLLAGGLFTPFTRRVLKMGMRAAVVPLAASQLKNFTNIPGIEQ